MNGVRLSDDYRSQLRQFIKTYNFVDAAIEGLSDIGAAGTVQAGAILRKTSTAVAGTEAGIVGAVNIHQVAQNKPHTMTALINMVQSATDQLEAVVGFASLSSGVVSGGDLAGDFSGAGLYSIAGETNWRSFVSVGTAQRKTLLDENGAVRNNPGGFLTGAGAQSIEVSLQPKTSTLFDVAISINDVPAAKYNDVDFTGILAVAPYVSVMGGSTTVETMDIHVLQHAFVRP